MIKIESSPRHLILATCVLAFSGCTFINEEHFSFFTFQDHRELKTQGRNFVPGRLFSVLLPL